MPSFEATSVAFPFDAASDRIRAGSILPSALSSSGTVKNGLAGATWAPAAMAPINATSISMELAMMRTTRFPRTACRSNDAASPVTARPNSR